MERSTFMKGGGFEWGVLKLRQVALLLPQDTPGHVFHQIREVFLVSVLAVELLGDVARQFRLLPGRDVEASLPDPRHDLICNETNVKIGSGRMRSLCSDLTQVGPSLG